MDEFYRLDIGWRSALMFALCLPILAASIMLAFRQVERRANIFLALFLFATAFVQIPQIIGFAGAYDIWPGLSFFPFDTELYLGPLLYLHAFCLTRKEPLDWRKYLLLPGAALTFYYLAIFLLMSDYRDRWDFAGAVHNPYIWPAILIVIIALSVWSFWATLRLIRHYRLFLLDTESTISDFDPVWLARMIWMVASGGLAFILLQIYLLATGPMDYRAAFPFQFFMMAVLMWFALEALSRTVHSFPKIYTPLSGSATTEPLPNPGRDWTKEGQKLLATIKDGKWYLDTSLSLREVARRMGSNESYISRAINTGLGSNFNTLINGMRIDHAKNLLRGSDESVIQIAMESGFNSKPTFNRVFREITGQTPSEFKTRNR